MSAHEDAVTSMVNGGYSQRIAREILAGVLGEAQTEDRRVLATRIREVGTAKGWSTWAAAYIDPDTEFVDTGMPSTETIVAELRRLDRVTTLREVEAAITAAIDRSREHSDDDGLRVRRLGMRAVERLVRGLREEAEGWEKDTGGSKPSAGESTPAPAEPYSYIDAHNHRLTFLSTTDDTGSPYVWLQASNLEHGAAEVSVWLPPLAAQALDRYLASGIASGNFEHTDHTGDQLTVYPGATWTAFDLTCYSDGSETPDRVRVAVLTARLPEVRDGLRSAMRQAEEKAARETTSRATGKTSHDGYDGEETR